ncbi:MAG: Asp-tRNA(Asn)/Glu-tRNA(Gln) amidotransferase subunit GatC [Deltaproteobacteria bacterium]|nr:Asp-tRNA(Asn)/Glu-tRNA(Gln) amidotransferase subunit GatC [Deltaproteobacteria bacterium]
MKLSKPEVEHIAFLARLQLGTKEIETITQQLNSILGYMEKLSELDTSGIEPTTHALHLSNAFREDRVVPSLDRDEVLDLAPDQGGSAFVVPKVI